MTTVCLSVHAPHTVVQGLILCAARCWSEKPLYRIVDMVEAPEWSINILMLQVVGVSGDTAAGLLQHIVLVHVQLLNPHSFIF